MTNRLTGLIAAAFTPMRPDGELKLSLVPETVDYLFATGLSGIYVCGSTGEGPSLTGEERRAVAEAFVAASDGRLPVIVQVGHNSVPESKELAAHAQSMGADMISACSPSYFKPDCLDTLISSVSEVASGAPELPFYYYHIPSFTGVPLDMVEFLERGAEQIPNLVGIKYSDFSIFEYQACLNCCEGSFDVLWGCDEMLLSALVVGARGAVGSTFSVMAPLYLSIIDSFERGDLESASRYQHESVQFVRILSRYAPLHTSLKAVMRFVGLDSGDVRLPQRPMPNGVWEKIHADLCASGLVRWLATL
jgi:N-acetylneuraminate lyase